MNPQALPIFKAIDAATKTGSGNCADDEILRFCKVELGFLWETLDYLRAEGYVKSFFAHGHWFHYSTGKDNQ